MTITIASANGYNLNPLNIYNVDDNFLRNKIKYSPHKITIIHPSEEIITIIITIGKKIFVRVSLFQKALSAN